VHGDVVVIVLLLVCGCAAFLFGAIYLVCQLFIGLGRGLMSVVTPGKQRGASTVAARPGRALACPNSHCRKIERRPAQYCSQCGTSLSDSPHWAKL
jgi:hypothetical protein